MKPQVKTAPKKPPPAPPAPAGKDTIFVHVYPGKGVDPDLVAGTASGVMTALDPERFVQVDLEALYGDGARVPGLLDAADRQVARAQELLNQLEIQAAETALDEAVLAYETHLVGLLARDGALDRLAAVHALRALARFLDADEENAIRHLHRAFVLDPEVHKSGLFPPDMAPAVARERKRFEDLPTGALDVTVPGVPAQIIVNGTEFASAPAHFEGLPAGTAYVTLSAAGYPTLTTSIVVEPGETARLEQELAPYPGDPLARVRKAEEEAGKGRMGKRLLAAAEAVGKPGKLLLVTMRASGEAAQATAYLYDTRSGKLEGKASASVAGPDPAPAASELARSLLSGEPIATAPPDEGGDDDDDDRPPFWRHRYFWPAVAVAGGVLATGVLIGIAASDGLSAGQRVVILGLSF